MPDQQLNLERATESTVAKAFARFGMPLMVAVIGFLGTWMLNSISNDVQDIGALQSKQADEVKQVSSDVRVLKATVDTGLLWRIGELERRINHVEQATRTP